MADRKGFVGIRLTSDGLAEIDRLAAADGVTRSDMIRLLLDLGVAAKTRADRNYLAATVRPEPEPERIPEVEALIRPDGPEVDAAIARHPAGKRRHDGHRTDSRSGGSCSGCRDCRGWSPIVAGGMRCKCGHPVRMH